MQMAGEDYPPWVTSRVDLILGFVFSVFYVLFHVGLAVVGVRRRRHFLRKELARFPEHDDQLHRFSSYRRQISRQSTLPDPAKDEQSEPATPTAKGKQPAGNAVQPEQNSEQPEPAPPAVAWRPSSPS